jgi:3-methyladenine DNA glycosylase AlkD
VIDAQQAAAGTRDLLGRYDPGEPTATADALQQLWLRGAPVAGQALARDWGIDDPDYEAVGTPVPVLTAMGKEIGKRARKRVGAFLSLVRLLWDEYGREGRIVAAIGLGPMELADPGAVVPAIYGMAQTCVFWEDCDQLAMKALEPILRKDPDTWLEPLGRWVTDENKWVRRAALTAVGRLPMVCAESTGRCVELMSPALGDPDTDVKRALSFALRLSARGDPLPAKAFIVSHQDVTDTHSLWVMCDVIRSMWKALLPEFVDLLPIYRAWLEQGDPKAKRSTEAAIRILESVQ